MIVEVKVVNGMPLPKFALILALSAFGGLLSVGALGAIFSPDKINGLF